MARSRDRDGKLILCVGKPSAAIVKNEMPFVPGSQIVFIDNSSYRDKRLTLIHTLRANLNGRDIRREVRDLTDLLQIEVSSHENGFTILTDGLNAAGPTEHDFCAA